MIICQSKGYSVVTILASVAAIEARSFYILQSIFRRSMVQNFLILDAAGVDLVHVTFLHHVLLVQGRVLDPGNLEQSRIFLLDTVAWLFEISLSIKKVALYYEARSF